MRRENSIARSARGERADGDPRLRRGASPGGASSPRPEAPSFAPPGATAIGTVALRRGPLAPATADGDPPASGDPPPPGLSCRAPAAQPTPRRSPRSRRPRGRSRPRFVPSESQRPWAYSAASPSRSLDLLALDLAGEADRLCDFRVLEAATSCAASRGRGCAPLGGTKGNQRGTDGALSRAAWVAMIDTDSRHERREVLAPAARPRRSRSCARRAFPTVRRRVAVGGGVVRVARASARPASTPALAHGGGVTPRVLALSLRPEDGDARSRLDPDAASGASKLPERGESAALGAVHDVLSPVEAIKTRPRGVSSSPKPRSARTLIARNERAPVNPRSAGGGPVEAPGGPATKCIVLVG
jgi:hypothetical protein